MALTMALRPKSISITLSDKRDTNFQYRQVNLKSNTVAASLSSVKCDTVVALKA